MADVTGYAITWNSPAVISGLFEERFAPGAFDKSLRDHPDVVALWAHDASRPLGRVSNGTLEFTSDRVGLYYRLKLNPESPMGQEAAATVGRGDVGQVSVGLSSLVEEWDDRHELPRRLVTEAQLHEISLLVWGAYGDATSAALLVDNRTAAARRIAERQAAMERKFRGR